MEVQFLPLVPKIMKPLTAAAKVQIVTQMLNPEPYLDEETGVIVQPEPVITIDEARELLGFPPLDVGATSEDEN
jgi:hypothetical protein